MNTFPQVGNRPSIDYLSLCVPYLVREKDSKSICAVVRGNISLMRIQGE